jgi:hypothetical protein
MKSSRLMTRSFFPALLLVGVACAPDIPRPPPSERPATPVALPPSPTLEARPYKKLRDDGSYTVEGVLRDRDRIMGELVTVTGRVARVVKCAPVEVAPAPAPSARGEGKGQTPPLPPTVPATCNPPQHAVLVDPDAGPTPRWELVVYGTMRSALAGLSEGQEASLSGDFAMMSKDGVFLRQGGMLLLPDDPAPGQPVTP